MGNCAGAKSSRKKEDIPSALKQIREAQARYFDKNIENKLDSDDDNEDSIFDGIDNDFGSQVCAIVHTL